MSAKGWAKSGRSALAQPLRRRFIHPGRTRGGTGGMGTKGEHMKSSDTIIVHPYQPSQAAEWKAFLAASNNGTLFHDLDFLAYHPPNRFHTHHLMFYQSEKLTALLPAAIVTESDGRRFLKSPYGGSVGGVVLPSGMRAATTLDLINQLQAYVADLGLDGIEMRMGPNIYLRSPNNLLDFSLMARSFRLTKRWLLHIVPLGGSRTELIDRLFSKNKRYEVRSNLKKGLRPREVGADGVDNFYDLLLETQSRHEATPTHQKHEIEDLFRRVPERLRLFLCAYGDTETAGVLVFMLNESVAYTFYICSSYEHRRLCGPAVLIAHIIERMAEEGLRHLDLGPSTSGDFSLGSGVAFFKEGLGAQGFCRDTWRWERE